MAGKASGGPFNRPAPPAQGPQKEEYPGGGIRIRGNSRVIPPPTVVMLSAHESMGSPLQRLQRGLRGGELFSDETGRPVGGFAREGEEIAQQPIGSLTCKDELHGPLKHDHIFVPHRQEGLSVGV
jgi:hypothetical protein